MDLSDFDKEWESLINGVELPTYKVHTNDTHTKRHSDSKREKTDASDEEESDSQSEKASSEEGDANDEQSSAVLEAVHSTFNTLILQVDELRQKYKSESEARKNMELVNKKLILQVTQLEEENAEMQDALKNKVDSNRRGSVAPATSGRRNKRLNMRNDAGATTDQNLQVALMEGGDDDDFSLGLQDSVKANSILASFSRSIFRMMPFEKDIRVIQASFGGAVAAYFTFFRWMIFNWVVVACTGAIFAIIHILAMIFRSRSGSLLKGNGILPAFMEFSSFHKNEKFVYSANVVFVVAVLVIICVSKLIAEDKLMKRLDLIENENDFTFSKDVLCGWDNSLTQGAEVADLHGLMKQMYREKLAELKLAGLRKARSNLKILELYARRFVGLVVYLAVQLASYSSIVYLTVKSQSIQNGLSVGVLKSLSAFIVPAAVTTINSVTPGIYKLLTTIELWDSGQVQLNVLLFRMYISNMMNLLILAISYALLADPYLFAGKSDHDMRRQVEHEFTPGDFDCRMNEAANGLFTLILTEFFLNGLVFWGMGIVKTLTNTYIMAAPKKEFNIAQRMVAMLYFVSLMLLTFPFAPLSVIVLPFMLAARIKWEKYVTLRYYAKPKAVWTAHKAGSFFVLFYIMSLTFVAIPSAVYFLSRETFSKSCAIQDAHVELCSGAVGANDTCTLDPKSDFYKLYSDDTYCEEGYPACICQFSCGPFVDERNAFAPFRKTLQSIVLVDIIWEYIFKTSYGAWSLAGLFYIVSRMRRNTVHVNSQGYEEKERSFETHITALENEKKKHEKLINRLKLLDAPSTGPVIPPLESNGNS